MVIVKKAIENEEVKYKISSLLNFMNIKYKDLSIYILAFIHKSIVNERPDFAPVHNERLEFLWDAVLELVITNRLYRDYSEKNEWELTDIRSALVRWKNLARISRELCFNDYLLLWKWEEAGWWRENDYLLANTLESFLWAIYIDLWIDEATFFVEKYIYFTLKDIFDNNSFKDFKSLIQEYAQAVFDITPTYDVLEESGPDHDKNFNVWIYLKNIKIWEWSWSSKKKAQESAAKNAFEKKETIIL